MIAREQVAITVDLGVARGDLDGGHGDVLWKGDFDPRSSEIPCPRVPGGLEVAVEEPRDLRDVVTVRRRDAGLRLDRVQEIDLLLGRPCRFLGSGRLRGRYPRLGRRSRRFLRILTAAGGREHQDERDRHRINHTPESHARRAPWTRAPGSIVQR